VATGVDPEKFFGQAVARTNPTTMNGLLRLVVECSVYFNENRGSFNILAEKLTYVIDSLFRRSRGSPSFENKVWAISLISSSWSALYREARAIDEKNEEERKVLLNAVLPSLSGVSELAREYASLGIRNTQDI
jgi:hypothetical protein